MRFSFPNYMKNKLSFFLLQSGGLTADTHAMQQIQALDINNGR